MFQKIRNSWTIFKASAAVLAADKELIIFPVVSGIASILVMASFVLPITFLGGWRYVGGEGGWNPLGIAVAFLFYFCLNAVVFYFNAALVGAALIRLDGGDPTVSDGLRIANSRLVPILGYAAISATVGLLLKWGRGRSGKLGRFVISLVGIAWTLATYLVVPVSGSATGQPHRRHQRECSYISPHLGRTGGGNRRDRFDLLSGHFFIDYCWSYLDGAGSVRGAPRSDYPRGSHHSLDLRRDYRLHLRTQGNLHGGTLPFRHRWKSQ